MHAGSRPNSITLPGSKQVRSWFKPASVMEFGFNLLQLSMAAVCDYIAEDCVDYAASVDSEH